MVLLTRARVMPKRLKASAAAATFGSAYHRQRARPPSRSVPVSVTVQSPLHSQSQTLMASVANVGCPSFMLDAAESLKVVGGAKPHASPRTRERALSGFGVPGATGRQFHLSIGASQRIRSDDCPSAEEKVCASALTIYPYHRTARTAYQLPHSIGPDRRPFPTLTNEISATAPVDPVAVFSCASKRKRNP